MAAWRDRSRTPGPKGSGKPEEWYCLQCQEHNFSRNETCRKCGTPASQGCPLTDLPIENFLTGYPVEGHVLEQLKTMPRDQQILVMKVGTLKGAKDVNAVLIKRMVNAKQGIISGYGSGPKGAGKGGWGGDMSTMLAMMASLASADWSWESDTTDTWGGGTSGKVVGGGGDVWGGAGAKGGGDVWGGKGGKGGSVDAWAGAGGKGGGDAWGAAGGKGGGGDAWGGAGGKGGTVDVWGGKGSKGAGDTWGGAGGKGGGGDVWSSTSGKGGDIWGGVGVDAWGSKGTSKTGWSEERWSPSPKGSWKGDSGYGKGDSGFDGFAMGKGDLLAALMSWGKGKGKY